MSGGADLDRELAGLAPEARMEVWANRALAMLFAAAEPVDRATLAAAIGRDVAVEAVIGDLGARLAGTSLELARAGGGWMLRTRRDYAAAVRLARGEAAAAEEMTAHELAVLAAIAYYQPVSRADLGAVFGQVPGDALLGRLRARDLIAAGPRGPGRGAPQTFVTTRAFLAAFDLEDLRAFDADVPILGEGTVPRAGAREPATGARRGGG